MLTWISYELRFSFQLFASTYVDSFLDYTIALLYYDRICALNSYGVTLDYDLHFN